MIPGLTVRINVGARRDFRHLLWRMAPPCSEKGEPIGMAARFFPDDFKGRCQGVTHHEYKLSNDCAARM
jgi:hypothetical protein